jgi:transcriptional regulator with PAS, ATPase and Fis domain
MAQDTEQTGAIAPVRGTALHSLLHLVMEAARPLAGGARQSLDGVDEVVLGRGDRRGAARRTVDGRTVLRVEVPDRKMSVSHARLVLGEGRVVLEDLGSTNGTRVDGAPVERATLRPGALVEVGQTFFVYAEVEERIDWRADDVDNETAPPRPTGLVTLDPVLAVRLGRLERVAGSPVAVMLRGETGTGKEVLARAVHELSGRPGPLVAVNCGAIPASLVESTLFGHLRGAFSGAVRDEMGTVRAAHRGTLFLDEIGDLPPSSQAALLRVLQEAEVVPIGATRAVKVDVRVISATHRPLEELMERGSFRRDLYARLAGFECELPRLRDRIVDAGLLVAALLRSSRVRDGDSLRFRGDAARALLRYAWPLNVRELQQCLATSSVLAEEGLVRLADLPPSIAAEATTPPEPESGTGSDDAIRRELMLRFAEARGNLSEVARAMGKARQQVQRWARRFGIDAEAFRDRGSE